MKYKFIYFFAANRHEGCGHQHRKQMPAIRCLRRLQKRGFQGKVYRTTVEQV